MPSQREKFIQLRERLRASAEQKGDAAFAEGLTQCMLNVSGGNQECPMGQLIFDDYVKTGKLPHPSQTHSPSTTRQPSPVSPIPQNRKMIVERLHKLLKDEAQWKHDERLTQALLKCDHFRDANPNCPLHRLIHE